MITIIAVGKKHEDWVKVGIERYEKRLRAPFDVTWVLLPHSSLEGAAARQEESERVLKRLPSHATVLLLDERGQSATSHDFSQLVGQAAQQSGGIFIVIGGAYGVNDALQARASTIVSLSGMVFPHQLVRLILTEQLYRAQEIARGGRYHHI